MTRPRASAFARQALLACISLSLLATTCIAADPPALLLAHTYRGGVDLSRYRVSEKLDGVRAYWDGSRLLSRGGNEIRAPHWFLARLPRDKLDGELWLGRGRFEALSGLVRREVADDAHWQQVRYLVFELPDAPGTFEQRAERIRAIVARTNVPWLAAVEQFRVTDERALMVRLASVVKSGGEGLMLHLAAAPYTTGRSEVLLKVKPWQDAEATVIGHLPGRGKHAGRLGALRVRAPDGREFAIGTGFSDAQRRDPPPIGTTVTYRYRDLTAKGTPRHASLWRVRDDF